MLLGGFMLVPCVGALSLAALNWGVLLGLPWTWSHQEARHLLGLERDAITWVWVNAQAQEGKKPWGQTLAQRKKKLLVKG